MKIKKIASLTAGTLALGILMFGLSFSAEAATTKAKAKTVAVKVAAVVNGVSVNKTVYDEMLAANIANFKSQGVNVTDAEKLKKIKELTMDDLVVNEVIKQEVKKQKMEATPKQIEAKFQELVKEEGGKDKMKAKLASVKMTEKKLRENISAQLTNKAFFEKNVSFAGVTVTDAEISSFYNANVKGKEGAPELATLSAEIKQHLTDQKKTTLVENYIATLKASAKYKTNI